MRARFRIVALAVALTVVAPAAASAEWFVTPFLGIKFASSTSIVESRVRREQSEDDAWRLGHHPE